MAKYKRMISMMVSKQAVLDLAAKDYRPSIVLIDPQMVNEVAAHVDAMADRESSLDYWYPLNGHWGLQSAALYWTVFSAQAFRFWRINTAGRKEKLHYAGATGSNAMFAIIKDCWKTDSTSTEVFDVKRFQVSLIGRPAMSERVGIASELTAGWDRLSTIVRELVLKARSQSLNVYDAALLAEAFPRAFSDPYLKKAQLAVSAISGLVKSQHPEVEGAVNLTAMADYQVPRVLRALGVLRYSTDLADKVSRHQLIDAGSEEENAIRSATVLAVEQISQRANLSSPVVDNLIWSSQDVAGSDNFHLTETTSY